MPTVPSTKARIERVREALKPLYGLHRSSIGGTFSVLDEQGAVFIADWPIERIEEWAALQAQKRASAARV